MNSTRTRAALAGCLLAVAALAAAAPRLAPLDTPVRSGEARGFANTV